MYRTVTIGTNIALHIWKFLTVDLKSFHKNKSVWIEGEGWWTRCGDDFAMYTNIELFCFVPETNAICQLYCNKKRLGYERWVEKGRREYTYRTHAYTFNRGEMQDAHTYNMHLNIETCQYTEDVN